MLLRRQTTAELVRALESSTDRPLVKPSGMIYLGRVAAEVIRGRQEQHPRLCRRHFRLVAAARRRSAPERLVDEAPDHRVCLDPRHPEQDEEAVEGHLPHALGGLRETCR